MIDIAKLRITPEILALIAGIDEFKGTWRAIGTLAPERLRALRRVATIESIGSSTRIEGSQLSDAEVERILSNLEVKSFGSRDEQEVAGYAYVMEMVFESWKHIDLTESHIQQLHRDLLKYSEKDTRHRGAYKSVSNNVVAFDGEGKEVGVVFVTASVFDTPRLMTELLEWTNEQFEHRTLHLLLVIANFIVTFLAIHPFQDGNGRLSRALTTLLLLRSGYAYVPYSSLESVIEANKEKYYLALRRTQVTIRTNEPDWEPWLIFFLKSLSKQVSNLSEKVEREKIIVATIPELSVQILDHVKQHGSVTMAGMIKLTGKSRNTLKMHFRSLVADGHLKAHGQGRGSWYGKV